MGALGSNPTMAAMGKGIKLNLPTDGTYAVINDAFQGSELYTTTIYDVLDQYIKMYGTDAAIPVTRTPVGNIATSAVQREPELFRTFAMKGTEIMLRTASGCFSDLDVRACAMYNSMYTTICSNAVSPGNPNFFVDVGSRSGGSMILGPGGEELAVTKPHETSLSARIPMAEFRQRHRQLVVHMDLYRPIFDAYQNVYGPNLFSDYLQIFTTRVIILKTNHFGSSQSSITRRSYMIRELHRQLSDSVKKVELESSGSIHIRQTH